MAAPSKHATLDEEMEEKKSKTSKHRNSNISEIKNKLRRKKAYIELKREKKKVKIAEAKEKKKNADELGDGVLPKKQPHTIDNMRENDVTMVEDDEDEELNHEEATDTYAPYFTKSYVPKVLVTCSDNPHTKTIGFMRELCKIVPGANPFWRKRSSIKKMVIGAVDRGYTDVLVVNEDKRLPNGLLVIHLPEGPAAFFRISNPRLCKDIHRNYRDITSHRPEVMLNNFKTRLGRVVARMLGALFHYEPEFKGRRVCTFHNQRDYIFFRHHRYEFKNTEKVKLREMGPRFTLRLQWLQEGAFEGDYEWVLKRHDMETSRRRFFL